ncbi:hypothetical protein [Gordonia aurantiaca]|uniref:hypothetical protein n=1 Tax=Gordonia sp. B21 TaxID=3151852 RepID=UPI00326616A2
MIRIAKRALVAAVAVLTQLVVFAPPASAAEVTWKGVTWDGSARLDGKRLVVDAGTAHYGPPVESRRRGTAFQATYIDHGSGHPKPSVYVIKKETETPFAVAWFGVATNPRPADATHPEPWDDYIAQRYTANINDIPYVGVGRRPGVHTVRIGLRDDGKVDYWLDGCVTKTFDDFGLAYLGDIYLEARNGSVTFTDFKMIPFYRTPTDAQNCRTGDAWGSLAL